MLIVEDGSGKADAESFISVSDATAYHASRGNAAWAALASDAVREQCLRRAADYMEMVYRGAWAGYRYTAVQALSWPRATVPQKDAPGGYGPYPNYYPFNAIPVGVANACAELALKAATQTLAPDVGRVTTREKVGEIEVDYAIGQLPYVRFRAIDMMLDQFCKASIGSVTVVRS